MNPYSDTLSSEEAAERLGVKLQTLYAYTSRGWIRPSDIELAARFQGKNSGICFKTYIRAAFEQCADVFWA